VSYFDELRLSSWAKRKHYRLEKAVLQEASKVLTVSWKWAKDFEQLGAKNKVAVITNGYEASTKSDVIANKKNPATFVISHIGTLSDSRNVIPLWKALKKIIEQQLIPKKIIIRFIGSVEVSILEKLKLLGLADHIEFPGYMSRAAAFEEMLTADLLLLVGIPGERGVVPGKFFEYLQAKKPILSVSPKGSDVALILKDLQAGANVDFEDTPTFIENKIKPLLLKPTDYVTEETKFQSFSREQLTKKLASLFNEVVRKRKK